MTSRYATEMDFEKLTLHQEQLAPASSEDIYNRLTGYGFARRFVAGKIVADIEWEEVGVGLRLLAETAASVEVLTNSTEAVRPISAAYSATNVSYRNVNLSELPHSEGYFDVVVAFGVIEHLEHPEGLIREAKRVLKQGGTLITSALDKQTNTNERNREGVEGRREMYVPEFRELLERHFERVDIYRQGAVAGGFVFPASEERTGTLIESARFSLPDPDLGTEPPTTRSVIGVCSDAEAFGQEKQPYLLLDRARRVFDECEERAEDVELMRSEIHQIQETEVRAFIDLVEWHVRLAAEVNRNLIRFFDIMWKIGLWLLLYDFDQRGNDILRHLGTIHSSIRRRLARLLFDDK